MKITGSSINSYFVIAFRTRARIITIKRDSITTANYISSTGNFIAFGINFDITKINSTNTIVSSKTIIEIYRKNDDLTWRQWWISNPIIAW